MYLPSNEFPGLMPGWPLTAGMPSLPQQLSQWAAYHELVKPGNQSPWTSTDLLGLTGGLAFGYRAMAQGPQLSLLAAHGSELRAAQTGLARAGIETRRLELHHADEVEQHLADALATAEPIALRVAGGTLPYDLWGLRTPGRSQLALACGQDDATGYVWLAGPGAQPWAMPWEALLAAILQAPGTPLLLMLAQALSLIEPQVFLRESHLQALEQQCMALLDPDNQQAGLHELEQWADDLAGHGRTPWATLYDTPERLWDALAACFAAIETADTGGQAGRARYADYLDGLAQALAHDALRDVAFLYRQAAQCWHDLAVALLPEAQPVAERTKALLLDQHRRLHSEGAAWLTPQERMSADLRWQALRAEAAQDFLPHRTALFNELRDLVLLVAQAEEQAAVALTETLLSLREFADDDDGSAI